MKRSMKKSAVFVMMAAIAIFIAVATADAFGSGLLNTIWGEFAVTGSNACLVAFPPGFDPSLTGPTSLTPLDGSTHGIAQTWEGVYTFKHSGTGALDVVAHDVGSSPTGGGASASIHWEFKYTVKPGGTITFTLVPGSYVGKWLTGPQAGQAFFLDVGDSWDGVISPDGNHMLVTWGAPLILYILDSQGGNRVGVQLICNGSFVLFRIQ